MSISVLILTRNEEVNLRACLDAVRWSDDVIVFDSFSSDRTVEIARRAGARVFQRHFDNERHQRTASLRLPFRHRWVYNPDADEIATPELREEMLGIAADPSCLESAFRVRFKTIFQGHWIRHSSLYPTWVVRLFRPERLSFERSVNLRYVIDGPQGQLHNHFEHHTFDKGLHEWFEKHNRYSSLEAVENLRTLASPSFPWGQLLAVSAVERRRALKELSFRMPFRPALRFLYMYVFRQGMLDGRAGFDYCLMLAFYEMLIVLKVKELFAAEHSRRHYRDEDAVAESFAALPPLKPSSTAKSS